MKPFSKLNKGINYVSTIIDMFTKYSWIAPLKTKMGIAVAVAFQKIYKGRTPTRL